MSGQRNHEGGGVRVVHHGEEGESVADEEEEVAQVGNRSDRPAETEHARDHRPITALRQLFEGLNSVRLNQVITCLSPGTI